MLQVLKNVNIQKYFQNLRDVRMLGLTIFVGVIFLVTWSGIGVIQTNYDLQKKISALQQEANLQRLENSNLALRNNYFETDEYLELQARRHFSKAAPGEKLLVVPKQTALQNSVEPLKQTSAEDSLNETQKPFYQRNFEAWSDFLFRSGSRQ